MVTCCQVHGITPKNNQTQKYGNGPWYNFTHEVNNKVMDFAIDQFSLLQLIKDDIKQVTHTNN